MTPQLTKIAECLSESNAREIKLARCLAESLKRIQTLESAAKTKDTKAKATELRFNAAMRELSEHYAERTAETEELIRQLEEAIKVDFPAQLAALKAEFATPAAQAAAPQSFNPRGAYEPGEKYKPFDYVSSNGSSYIALVENPTQPPSKKSKQWMLVAARGAGGGGVTGLGTAAYRDVGQAAGNLLELSASGIVSLVGLEIYDTGNEGYASIRLQSDTWTLGTTTSAGISFGTSSDYNLLINGTNISGNRTYTLPDVSGTLAITSQLPTFGTGVATALAINAGLAGSFVRTTDTATTTTAGTVLGIGGTVLTNAANLAFIASSAVMIWPTGSNIFQPASTGSGATTRNELSASATTGATSLSTSLVRSQGPNNFSFAAGTTYHTSSNAVDFDRPLIWSFNLGGMGAEVSTGTVRISFGKSSADGVGQLTRKGWQIRIEGAFTSRTVFIAAHNGTSLGTEVAVTGSAINNGGYDIKPVVVVCSGGTMSLYAGDAALNLTTPTATCTGGPTGASGNAPYLQVEVLNGATASAHRCDISNIKTVILK